MEPKDVLMIALVIDLCAVLVMWGVPGWGLLALALAMIVLSWVMALSRSKSVSPPKSSNSRKYPNKLV